MSTDSLEKGTPVIQHYFIIRSFTLDPYRTTFLSRSQTLHPRYPTCSPPPFFFFCFLLSVRCFSPCVWTMYAMYEKQSVSKHFKFWFLILSPISCFNSQNLVALQQNPELEGVRRESSSVDSGSRVSSPWLPQHIVLFKIAPRRSAVTRQPVLNRFAGASGEQDVKLRSVETGPFWTLVVTRWQYGSTVDAGVASVLPRKWEGASGDEHSSAH